jgi:hypothetical protein
MIKLTAEEAAKLPIGYQRAGGHSKYADYMTFIEGMTPGEQALLKMDEWHGKSWPGSVLSKRMREKGQKISVRRITDGSGWLITRL